MIDGIIFDMDGVLIDSEKTYLKRRLDFCEREGIIPSTESLEDFIGQTSETIWKKILPDNPANMDEIRARYKLYSEEHPIDFRTLLRPSVETLFVEMKKRGKKIAIASSSPRIEIETMLSATALKDYVDFFISGEEVAQSKPNPEIYLTAEKLLGKGAYIAVEDSVLGIEAAKKANLYTVALKQDYPIDQSAADMIITDISDLIHLIT